MFWIIRPLMILKLPLMTLIDLKNSRIVRMMIAKKIDMLLIK